MTTTSITADFPCYTGTKEACWPRPYEDLLDRLAAAIGMEHARKAFAVIGTDMQNQSHSRLMSPLLRAYGDDLVRYSHPLTQDGTHSRRVGA